MELRYDPTVDAASVIVIGPAEPGGGTYKDRLDQGRFVRYREGDGAVLEYEFQYARRHGVRLDDLPHREPLAQLFAAAGIPERDWSDPITTQIIRTRRDRAAG
ncbi:MAG: hypothetical protein IT306_28715 [Chloroflexi bacterium]|nr:hypothetical protein [Chloroflexota bacterium]